MQLIRTHDGLIGLKFQKVQPKVIWCDTVPEATRIAAAHYQNMEVSFEQMSRDIGTAIDLMAHNGDTIAEFGVFGGLMYTTTDGEYEF